MLEYLVMAQRLFAQHTAKMGVSIFKDQSPRMQVANADTQVWDLSSDVVFPLPSDLLEPVSISGQVYFELNNRATYIDPINTTPRKTPASGRGYQEWMNNSLRLSAPCGKDATLYIRYFAYWAEPNGDDDLLEIPVWSLNAMAFLIAYYAYTPFATTYATINQWKAGEEKGSPEDSSVRAQQKYMWKMYEQEIMHFQSQQRATMFRSMNDVYLHR